MEAQHMNNWMALGNEMAVVIVQQMYTLLSGSVKGKRRVPRLYFGLCLWCHG